MTDTRAGVPELLAPAGSPEALDAAIEAGADAVYLGTSLFSNRMRAKNFTPEELHRAVETCRTYGVRSYITLNTRLRERELPDALDVARTAWEWGADAFIVADAGLALLLREEIPDVRLHASTQMTWMCAGDAASFMKLGFSRMVCPRELSYPELCRLAKESPIEIEAFVHGAHCVSVSGQCLMSWVMGGRSGNRGECAQPCRLPYRVCGDGVGCETHGQVPDKGCAAIPGGGGARRKGDTRNPPCSDSHPLSLRDMCLASHIPELCDSGVRSLKLEGRLKSADYVYGVTSVYRRLLDERRRATPEEIEHLSRIFSRDGFTDGYFTENYKNMTGMRAEGAHTPETEFRGLEKKVPVSVSVKLTEGKPSSAVVSDGRFTVSVTGDAPEAARSAPLTEDAVYRSVSKLGATPYSLDRHDFSCELDGELFMTASQLNTLRRGAIEALNSAVCRMRNTDLPNARGRNGSDRLPDPSHLTDMGSTGAIDGDQYADTAKGGNVRSSDTAGGNSHSAGVTGGESSAQADERRPLITAQFLHSSSVPQCAWDSFDAVFLPHYDMNGPNPNVSLPEWAPDSAAVRKIARDAASRGARWALCHSPAEITAAANAGLIPIASMRFNVTNVYAAAAIHRLGAQLITLSPELPAAAVSGISRDAARCGIRCGAVVYGRLPLMLLRRCILRPGECSAPCGSDCAVHGAALIDRRKTAFPVSSAGSGTNVVWNSCPLWCADRMEALGNPAHLHFIFTDEDANEVSRVIDAYRRGDAPTGTVRRV